MRVLMIEPHRNPYPKNIAGDTPSIMAAVGGVFDIEYFDPEDRAVIFCNDLFQGQPANRMVGERMLCGTFFIAGNTQNTYGESVACSLTDEQIDRYTKMFAVPGAAVTQAQIRGIISSLDEDDGMIPTQ